MSGKLLYETWNDQDVSSIIDQTQDYIGLLKWAFQEYGDKIVYSCSFGAEGIVLIDLISKVKKDAKIIFLDTHLHFKETYELIDKVKERYPLLQIELIQPNLSLRAQAEKHGEELWKKNPNLCCYLRKIGPLKNALQGYDAWISGLRRDQSPTRKNTQYINKDNKFEKVKICPLIHWSWEDVMMYIELNQLPFNPLHEKGYPSIGCAPCTFPVKDNDDLRAGRWRGQSKTECGLHVET